MIQKLVGLVVLVLFCISVPFQLFSFSQSSSSWLPTQPWITEEENDARRPFHVFWNLYLPHAGSPKETQEVLDAMREQIDQVAHAQTIADNNKNIILNYITIGNANLIATDNQGNHVEQACAQHPGLVCHHVKHVEKGFEEVTLDVLYDHCNSQEAKHNDRVAYIHNKGSYHAAGWIDPATQREMRKDMWRRHGTAAALHPDCQNPPNDQCNVCGLLWTPVPWNHMPGNFFSAKCGYIRQLLQPTHYQDLHNHLFNTTYVPMVEQGKMIATKRFLMGQDRWAMEMWVGSHPSLKPCSLSREIGIKEWLWKDRLNEINSGQVFDFSMFPRGNDDMRTLFDHAEPRYNPELLDKPEIRFRDFNLLGGMITRWRYLYGQVPSPDSWIWSYYPDGMEWKTGLEQHGMAQVYEQLSKRYWVETKTNPPASTTEYSSTKCQKLSASGHCDDDLGGAWNYRKPDGSCAHTEATAPKDGGAVRGLPIIFPDVNVTGGGVLDFGGGPGIYLTGFRNHARQQLGISPTQPLNLVSVEPYPLKECLFEGLQQDTTDMLHTPLSQVPSQKYDLVMTIEVLEHIPVDFHEHIIQVLTQMTKKWLIVCAAHPGQPGEGHIGPSMKTREQWKDEILANVGHLLEYDEEKTKQLHEGTGPLIKQNGSVFRRKESGTTV